MPKVRLDDQDVDIYLVSSRPGSILSIKKHFGLISIDSAINSVAFIHIAHRLRLCEMHENTASAPNLKVLHCALRRCLRMRIWI